MLFILNNLLAGAVANPIRHQKFCSRLSKLSRLAYTFLVFGLINDFHLAFFSFLGTSVFLYGSLGVALHWLYKHLQAGFELVNIGFKSPYTCKYYGANFTGLWMRVAL